MQKKALDISMLANLGHTDVSSVLPALKHVGSMLSAHINPETFTTVAKHMGSGTAAHVLSNAALKKFRATAGNRALQSLGELGVKHGIEGKQVHPFLLDRVKQVVGPEPLAEYTGARNLLSKARGKLPQGSLSTSSMELASKHIRGLPATPSQIGMHIGEEVAKRNLIYHLILGLRTSLS